MKIFVNFSNHELTAEQVAAANADEVINWPFHEIDPEASAKDVADNARENARDLYGSIHQRFGGCNDVTVHVMGEMNFVHAFVNKAQEMGMKCVASTSKRNSVEVKQSDGSVKKIATFQFIQFREYV